MDSDPPSTACNSLLPFARGVGRRIGIRLSIGRGLGEDFFGADVVEGHVVSASGVEGPEDVGENVVGRNIVK